MPGIEKSEGHDKIANIHPVGAAALFRAEDLREPGTYLMKVIAAHENYHTAKNGPTAQSEPTSG